MTARMSVNLPMSEVIDMAHSEHQEEGVEVIGMVPSAIMVLSGLAIAILPVILQLIINAQI